MDKAPFGKGGEGGFIELDGGQHYSSEGKEKDRTRDEYMRDIGLRVLGFSDKRSLTIHKVFLKEYGVTVILKISPIPLFSKEENKSIHRKV